jgi:hypothetical protein
MQIEIRYFACHLSIGIILKVKFRRSEDKDVVILQQDHLLTKSPKIQNFSKLNSKDIKRSNQKCESLHM